MSHTNTKLNSILYLIPFIGILSFVVLYIYAATLYPGGSQANINSEGFSWVHNYWCNLLNETGMNGQPNKAQPVALTAMLLLCFSLAVFFIQFAKIYASSLTWKRIIQINGVLSMVFAALIFSPYHDLMTLLSSLFGVFVVIGILKGIYTSKQRIYQISGIICLLFLALNNYIYYTQHFLEALPLLQKITFTIVLLWILALNTTLKRKNG